MCFAFFGALDDQRGTDHLIGGGDVEEHLLFFLWCEENWRGREYVLEIVECLLCLVVPFELIAFFQQLIERECLFAQFVDESIECCDSAG